MHAIVLAAAAAALPATATAQEKSETPRIELDAGIAFDKPDGWVEKKGAGGVAVRLEAAGDSESYIEFRFAPDVDAKKAKTFFTSFHASLQSAGLKKVRDTTPKAYGKHDGEETQYETRSRDGDVFRLVIWQIHVGDKAWMVAGFFDEGERETLYGDFGKLIGVVAFE
jgi:hypothetical protein